MGLQQQVATSPVPVVDPVPWPTDLTLIAGFTALFTDSQGLQWGLLPNAQVPIPNVAAAEFTGVLGQTTIENQNKITAYDAACSDYQIGKTTTAPTPGNLTAFNQATASGVASVPDGSVLFAAITGPLAGPPCPSPVTVPKTAVFGMKLYDAAPGYPVYQAVVGSNLQAGDSVPCVAGVNGCPLTGQWLCCQWGMSPNAGLMFLG